MDKNKNSKKNICPAIKDHPSNKEAKSSLENGKVVYKLTTKINNVEKSKFVGRCEGCIQDGFKVCVNHKKKKDLLTIDDIKFENGEVYKKINESKSICYATLELPELITTSTQGRKKKNNDLNIVYENKDDPLLICQKDQKLIIKLRLAAESIINEFKTIKNIQKQEVFKDESNFKNNKLRESILEKQKEFELNETKEKENKNDKYNDSDSVLSIFSKSQNENDSILSDFDKKDKNEDDDNKSCISELSEENKTYSTNHTENIEIITSDDDDDQSDISCIEIEINKKSYALDPKSNRIYKHDGDLYGFLKEIKEKYASFRYENNHYIVCHYEKVICKDKNKSYFHDMISNKIFDDQLKYCGSIQYKNNIIQFKLK